jgi:hypothetical protein
MPYLTFNIFYNIQHFLMCMSTFDQTRFNIWIEKFNIGHLFRWTAGQPGEGAARRTRASTTHRRSARARHTPSRGLRRRQHRVAKEGVRGASTYRFCDRKTNHRRTHVARAGGRKRGVLRRTYGARAGGRERGMRGTAYGMWGPHVTRQTNLFQNKKSHKS